MAEGVATLFLKKLCELIANEHMPVGISHDVILLREKLQRISLSLKEADDKCLENEGVKLWVDQVRAAAFEAEDIIDNLLLKLELPRRKADLMRLLRKSIKRVIDLNKIRKDIQNINSRLDNILQKRQILGLGNIEGEGEPSLSYIRWETIIRRVEEVDLVGLEDEAKEVCKMLMEGDAPRSIVSIVGMGGLGKTAFATRVFNEMRITRHFECYAWITASQEFIGRDVLFELIRCLRTPSFNDFDKLKSMREEELREELSNYLERRRYLIVIDDIWRTEDWDRIQASFPNENNGSRVMLTTRNRDVALHADPCKNDPYELRLLTDEECWELLCKKAFLEVVGHEQEMVGKYMAKRCCGQPLTAVLLGGLLSTTEHSFHAWRRVLTSIDHYLHEGDSPINGILALSYNVLPCHLKMCFLYFAAFPEGSNICAANLFHMWIAEGFIQERVELTLEEVAEDYLLVLIQRSLIQVTEKHFTSRVKKCRIHHLLRDFAIRKAKENQFLDVDVHFASPTTIRRLSVSHTDICKYVSMDHSSHLHSLFCFIQYDAILRKENWNSYFKRFKFLRVMHLDSMLMVPDGIGDLIYLRYLFVRFKGQGHMLTLPSTISNLRNLQTLIILGAHKLLSFDHGIWKIRQLRHLVTSYGLFSPKADHKNLNELTNLQTLSMMTVGHWITGDYDNLTSLKSLGLGGGLNLFETALSNFIGRQVNLKSLQLVQIRDEKIPVHIISSHLRHLEKLQLSGPLEKIPALQEVAPRLTNLVLFNSRLVEDPMAVLEKLPKLQFLRLKSGSYLGKKMYCSAKGFSMLAVLEISFLEELEDWTVEEGALSNLRHLEIRKCSELKMIPEGFRHVATLQELALLEQPNAFLERVKENGPDWFKIQHVPSVLFISK